LLGEPVRYDGGHKRDRWVTDVLGPHVDFVPVCPEVECGLGTPRESMHLEGDPDQPRLVTTRTHEDLTDQMLSWAWTRVKELESQPLCGYIFKANSPSSGMERVRVYDANGVPTRTGVGLFARAFMDHFPLLPVEEEGRLHDAGLRENFIEQVFTVHRWRQMEAQGRRRGNLVQFHTENKLLIMAHSPKHLRELGPLVAHAKEKRPTELFAEYFERLMDALRLKATPAKHTNVLQHIMGYFKDELSADEKQELLEIIGEYRQGLVPLIVPVTLLNHYVRKYDQPYLAQQTYLHPHPAELKLRNHA
jgi:uncharacterized protein YbgA (DUF1722 family)/uncharacterized protein YbbK (DUF523 family)